MIARQLRRCLTALQPQRPAARRREKLRFDVLEDRLAPATVGGLDPGFGRAGKVVTNMAGFGDVGWDVAVQKDGKTIVAGEAFLTSGFDSAFALARYNTNGTLDTTFGRGGKVFTNFSRFGDTAFSVTVLANGKILAAGSASNGFHTVFAMARYHSNGQLDATFGTGGLVTDDVSELDNGIRDVAVQADGKIVAGGSARRPGNVDFALVRYAVNGQRDGSFGTGGLVLTAFAGNQSQINSIALQADGKVVAVGYTSVGPQVIDLDWGMARYTTTGGLDGSFGTGGKRTVNFGFSDRANGVVVQPDGKIVVAGVASTGSASGVFQWLAVARFTTTGADDNGFGVNGTTLTMFGTSTNSGFAVALQKDGKIVAAGSANGGNFGVVRLLTNGRADTTFGNAGRAITDFGLEESAFGVAVAPDGGIVAAGHAGSRDFVLARYLGKAFNRPPRNTVPRNAITVLKKVKAGLTVIRGVSVSDPDASTSHIRVQLSVSMGRGKVDIGTIGESRGFSGTIYKVNRATISGVTITRGTSTLTLVGSQANINKALAKLVFTPKSGSTGTGAVTIFMRTSDLGNSGAGGARFAIASLKLNVKA